MVMRESLPQQMTKSQFVAWLKEGRSPVYVWPAIVVPCNCGDVNCHGWRLVSSVGVGQRPIEFVDELVTVGE